MPKREDMKYWNVPVTPHLDAVLEKAVLLNAHVSKSDYIRSAVREKLSASGLKEELENVMQKLFEYCGECRHWQGRCLKGYMTKENEDTAACPEFAHAEFIQRKES